MGISRIRSTRRRKVLAAAFALVKTHGRGIGVDLARKRSDRPGGVVEHLDELD